MKILAVQGSPRPKTSNTEVLLREFLRGAAGQGAETETVYLTEKKIHPCVGCFTCWAKTPGICIFKDDMPELLDKVRGCDILAYATPLYNYSMTAYLKAFQERTLPLLDPRMVKMEDVYRHPQRYPHNRRMVLISTCGFPEVSHFDALRHIFRKLEKAGGVPLIGELLVPAAEMSLKQEFLREKSRPILEAAYQAGIEAVRDGRVAPQTEARIQQTLVPPEQVAAMANVWWDSLLSGTTSLEPREEGKIIQDIKILLLGMSALFNAGAAGGLSAVIQFEVSGKQPGSWFFSIEKGNCAFQEGKAASPSLTIKTPAEIWLAIANGELDGAKAFLEGKYAADGDIGLLLRMKDLFGSLARSEKP